MLDTDIESSCVSVPELEHTIRGDCPWCGRRDIAVDWSTRSCMNCGGYVAPLVQSQRGQSVSHLGKFWDDLIVRVDKARRGQTIYIDEDFAVIGAGSQCDETRLKNILNACRVKGVKLEYRRPAEKSWFALQLAEWQRKSRTRGGLYTREDEGRIMKSMQKDFMRQVEVIMQLYGRDENMVGLLAPQKKKRFKDKTKWMLADTRPDMTLEQKYMVSQMAVAKYDHQLAMDEANESDKSVVQTAVEKANQVFDDLPVVADTGRFSKEANELAWEDVDRVIPDCAMGAVNVSDLQYAVDECRKDAGIDMDSVITYNLAFIGLTLAAVFYTLYGMTIVGSLLYWLCVASLGVLALAVRMKWSDKFND